MYTVDIRRYTDPSRKLGYNIGDSKKQESLKSRLLSLILARGSLDYASRVANNRMHPIRKVQARERALELGLDPADWLHMEWSFFFLALRHGDRALAELILINAKADINLQDRRGRTLLHIAALAGDEDAAHLLRQHGAKSTGDRHGWLPIDIARSERFPRLFDTLSLTSSSPSGRQPLPSYPEPTKWADSSNPSEVVISDNGLVAFFAAKNTHGLGKRQSGAQWSVISNHPIPPNVDEYYFEVEILGACRSKR